MLALANPQTYWLNLTNIALGVAAFLIVSLLLRSVIQEVRARR